jgi:imidazolonepropionase-like amidohydrolase
MGSIRIFCTVLLLLSARLLMAQATFPENGVADPRSGYYALLHATLVKEAGTILTDATLVVKDGRIVAVGTGLPAPAGAVPLDCKGKFIYPSFIDLYADYGIPSATAATRGGGGGFDFLRPSQLESTQKGPYGWNQALRSDVQAHTQFAADDAKAKALRELGFGAVLSHVRDGIARGTGVAVTLANEKENLIIIKEKASAHYSFNKGSSQQSYPSSMMGSIALLRQTFLDAQWYKTQPAEEGLNLTLKSWNENQSLPQIFEAGDKWNVLRADRIGDEFGVQYIIKAGQTEYQRIADMKATKASFILPLNFPAAQDVEDPAEARFVALNDMKHWELAPTGPAAFEKAGIPFCLTTADLSNVSAFTRNLQKAREYGLSDAAALEALTRTPARMLGIDDKVGSLEVGKLANFLVTNGPLFNEKTLLLQNWIQGIKYTIKEDAAAANGSYQLIVNTASGKETYQLEMKSTSSATVYAKDTLLSKFSFDGKQVKISFAPAPVRQRPAMSDSTRRSGGPGGAARFMGAMEQPLPASATRLSGISNGTEWNGVGTDSLGNPLTWTATLVKLSSAPAMDSAKKKEMPLLGNVIYPFVAFGWDQGNQPKSETILIRNATVWTNESEGVLKETDVLLKGGKIAAVGKNLVDPTARVIDGTGKHVTPGIIDEHSHIAAASIHEGGQSVTSEVRIADNLNPDDINIYRQLSGGVTTSHILHGSANTIGGQTQLIKLRWGAGDEELKFKGWPGQIKFALGENVKRSSSPLGNNRYPDTRMGVEQILVDAFTRAKDYQRAWATYETNRKAFESAKNKKGLTAPLAPRRDLELDALVEILEKKRFITCHSYVQSEINSAMEVANRMGYTVNTFTHILEGYKVADKMKEHGSFASTFSDWWAYKMEVEDAIPYNAAIMQKVGLTVAINSDDAEMARRLNQEAAKIVKYGGVTEEQALKMVTLNPAIMLHVDDKVGSLRVGKDADVVLWSDHPLSIYAKSLYTIVDGTVYFDRAHDEQLQQQIEVERLRLVRKMNGEKRAGAPTIPAQPSYQLMHTCHDHGHSHGLLVIDNDETIQK